MIDPKTAFIGALYGIKAIARLRGVSVRQIERDLADGWLGAPRWITPCERAWTAEQVEAYRNACKARKRGRPRKRMQD